MEQPAITILNSNRIMTIATVRPDGWPQATMVGYANQGFRLYFLIYRTSQKFANIAQNNRVAITVAKEPAELRDIQAVYAGCAVHEVTHLAERSRAWELLAKRHPNLTDLAPPGNAEVATMAADCQHMSVLDYSEGLGHAETLTLADTSAEGTSVSQICRMDPPKTGATLR
ncbi:MAG TPA: pyridoxamine 5'-phosphate oxidase family protein [Sphingomicrobium sp.]|nr:pyridoxamine 5'-phosphate oxidase family protein [Sphingomicrobium sp.]